MTQTEARDTLGQLVEDVRSLSRQLDLGDIPGLDDNQDENLLDPVDQDQRNLERAQAIYLNIYQVGGDGSALAQEAVLGLIMAAEDSRSIPFWMQVLDLNRPRETTSHQDTRLKTVLSALKFLAIRCKAPEAYTALQQATHHARSQVRSLAIHYWISAYLEAKRPLPPDVLARLSDIAASDEAFEPRFQARVALRSLGQETAVDNPGGIYALKVKFKWNKRIYRTIELRSEQTLEDLHRAIQRAIQWCGDHLYSFYMNGKLRDHRYRFSCPYETDHPPWTSDAIIGELGLVKKHKFLYFFDYGDCHEFEVEVVGVYAQAESGSDYPRVVDSRGESPNQYGR